MRNERQWWAENVRPKWHHPLKKLLAWKVQDQYFSGMPDVLLNARGVVALCELKYEPKYPRTGDPKLFVEESLGGKGLKVLQRNRLQEWTDAGGLGLVFFGIDRDGFLVWFEDCVKEGFTVKQLTNKACLFCPKYEFAQVMHFLYHYGVQHGFTERAHARPGSTIGTAVRSYQPL